MPKPVYLLGRQQHRRVNAPEAVFNRLIPRLFNTMFLLGSRVPFITLDFVRQISLESFLGIWFGICLCLAIPWFLSAHSGRIRLSLAPSMAMYIAALMLKETFI